MFKIISPLLLGFLGLSVYGYAKRGLGWSPSKSLFVAFLGTIYFVALRASWDQLREEFGLIFFFIVLMLLLVNRKDRFVEELFCSFFSIDGCGGFSSTCFGA